MAHESLNKLKACPYIWGEGRGINMCHMVHRRRPTWFFLPHWCIMCRRKGDRADHIFVQSLVILSLRRICFARRASWMFPGCCVLLSEQHKAFGGGKKAKVSVPLLWNIFGLSPCPQCCALEIFFFFLPKKKMTSLKTFITYSNL